MRKAITTLQSVARLKGTDEAISEEDVYEVAGVSLICWTRCLAMLDPKFI